MIYLSHSHLLAKIDENGHIIDLVQVKTNRSNLSYIKKLRHLTTIIRNQNLYIRDSLLSDNITKGYTNGYTSIIIQTPNSKTYVVYDNTFYHWTMTILGLQLVIALLIGFVLTVIIIYKTLNNKMRLNVDKNGVNLACPVSHDIRDRQVRYDNNMQDKNVNVRQIAVSILNIISGGFFVSTICGACALKNIISSRFEPDYLIKMNRIRSARIINYIGIVFIGVEILVIVIIFLYMNNH